MTAADRELTVVVVTHQSAAVLGECLSALPAALGGAPPAEVVVVDNASTDGTVDLARRSDVVTEVLSTGSNAGYGAGVNAGEARRPGTDLLVLNPDVRLAPGSVAALYRTLARPGTGIAVPVVRDGDGVLAQSLRRAPTLRRTLGEAVLGARAGRRAAWGEVVQDLAAYRTETRADWATGAVWLVSRECRAAVGRWDESFFLYSEETDYALRAADAGFDLRLSPDAEAVHLGGESRTSPRLWALLTTNKAALLRRRTGRLPAAAATAVLAAGEAARGLRGDRVRAAGAAALLRPRAATIEAARRPTGDAPTWLCYSAQDWWYHNQAHSDFQLLRRVARDRRVLLVNSIGLRMPSPGKSTQVTRRIVRKVASTAKLVRTPLDDVPGFHVMTPVVLPLYHRPLVRRLNAVSVRWQVAAVRRWLRMTDVPVVVATIPTAWDVVAPTERRALVYNRSDRHSDFPESDHGTIAALEDALLDNADRVLYVSRTLMDEERGRTGDRAHFLDHGVDVEHFRRRTGAEPADLAAVPGPRIGFFGSLDDYLVDFELLAAIARGIPEASLVLIGDATRPMDDLVALPNVHWLGYRPYEQIPAYGSGFDVALMPWLDNEWIARSNPIKMKEYLALGLPVVSTDFPEARHYADRIRLTRGHEAFVEAVRQTLRDGGLQTPDERRESVLLASWDARAAELVALAEAAGGGR